MHAGQHPPKTGVSSFMGYLKGKSSLLMFYRHANLKQKFENGWFWSEGRCMPTVSLIDGTIAKYARGQERPDIAPSRPGVK